MDVGVSQRADGVVALLIGAYPQDVWSVYCHVWVYGESGTTSL